MNVAEIAAQIRSAVRRALAVFAENPTGILIGLGGVALCFGAFYTCGLLMPDGPLRPPGWICDAPGPQWKTAGCVPAPGYHFEARNKQQVAVHDITHTAAARQRDLDIGDAWDLLTNKQRQQIIDGKATIYNFVEPVK
jgi:hypothetical protein